MKYDCQHCGVDAPSKVAMAKHLRACHRDKLPPRKNGSCELQSSDKDFEDDDNCSNNQAEDPEEVTKVDTRRTVINFVLYSQQAGFRYLSGNRLT